MKQTWYLLNSGSCPASYNMALDECLLNWQSNGLMKPTIRFYQWNNPTVSTGYFQKATKELDLEAINRHNFSLVRRLTGGRAVLHDNELTYSVIVSEDYPHMPTTVVDAYRVISKGLLLGFQQLGLDAYFAVPHTEEEKDALKNPRSSVCFDAPSYYELVVEGRKIAGSAQTRQKGVILQHGSIPLTIDLDALYDVFIFPNEKVKERMKEGFRKKAVAINELTDRIFTIEDIQAAFTNGFAEALQIDLVPYTLTEEQEQEVLQLAKEKYENIDWNLKY
ncbi:MAG: biotin/lipoate A/B protein ligase family protein [Bacillaceae bacterium]